MATAHRPLLVKKRDLEEHNNFVDVEGNYFVYDMSTDGQQQTLEISPLRHPAVGPLHYRPLAVSRSAAGGADVVGVTLPPAAAASANPPVMLAVGDDTVIKMDTVIYYECSSTPRYSGFEMLTKDDDHVGWRSIPLPRPPFRTLRLPCQSVTIKAYFAMGTRAWISVAGEGTFSLDPYLGFWQVEFPEELCRLEGRAFFAPELGAVVGLTGGDDRFLCSYKVDDADMNKWTLLRRSEVPMMWQHTWSESVPWECFHMGPIGFAPWRDKASLAYLGDGTFCVHRPVNMLGTDLLHLNSYMVLQLRRRQPDGKELEIAKRGAVQIKGGIWPPGQDIYFIQ